MDLLRQTLASIWDQETSDKSDWTPAQPSKGQCAVTALLVQDLLDGEIQTVEAEEHNHHFNLIDEQVVDLTEDQFASPPNHIGRQVLKREQLLADKGTNDRYEMLKSRFDAKADIVLPLREQDHIAIRDPNYVAGSSDRPEVAIFAQSRTDRIPLPDRRMAPGQKVWMKWNGGGPIVACSSVLSWHSAEFTGGQINAVRELSIGTRLYGLDDYWAEVQKKGDGWVSVVRLKDERWLNRPFYGASRLRGSSWLHLNTLRKKTLWLSKTWEPITPETTKGREIPIGLKFKVRVRDNFTCRYCGAKAPEVPLHVDHVKPWSEVKCHEEHNLVTSCKDCNLGKGARPLTPDQIATIHRENREHIAKREREEAV